MDKSERRAGTANEQPTNEQPGCLVIRILVVDDHPLVRRGIRELVNSQPDMEICGEAADEEEALRLLTEVGPDLVLVDISLRQGNGIDLVKRIKPTHPAIRTVVLSVYEEEHYAERALRAGAVGYVHKEEPCETLLQAIRQVLQGQLYLSAQMTSRMLRRFRGRSPNLSTSPIDTLSDRELEVFGLIGQGLATGQIADKLDLRIKTVETYRERLKNKLNLKNAAELNYRAVQWVLEQESATPRPHQT